MKKLTRYALFVIYLNSSIILFILLNLLFFHFKLTEIITDWAFLITIFLYLITIEEFYRWAKNSKRSEMSDIVALAFFFFLILFFSKDLLTSLMGAFSIYLWIGIFELKDYPVINKLLIISLVTYNVIFIAGIFSFYLEDPIFINTSFAFSFWIILILGFILFGRKYIVVWRFLSPEYLTLLLFIIAWLAVIFINEYTPLKFVVSQPFNITQFNLVEFFMNIYFILIVVNWLIYFCSGPILDKLLGIKKIKGENLLGLVNKVKQDMRIKGKVKIGFGKYPILNAMAYGSFLDKRIAIIAEEIDQIPKDELKGIIAHELAHTRGKHTLILTFISSVDLIVRMFLGIPATYYDYTFGAPQIPLLTFIFLNLTVYIILFIFVRILEGKADLNAKRAGYGCELAKALYNFEGFYAKGREIGFNTMLLCEEKITKDNKLLDYFTTGAYLYQSMIKPSRLSLLGNFLNSHPPSYYRIAAILSNELKPGKEAILPFICLKRSKQKKYAKKFESARLAFRNIANEKFKEYFEIEDVSLLMEDIKRKELYRFDLDNVFIFKNKITDEIKIGKLIDIQFNDNICDSDRFIIIDLKTNQKDYLHSSIYSLIQIDLNEIYFLKKENPLVLTDIYLNKDKTDGYYIFLDKANNNIQKPILKTKLPKSAKFIRNLKDHHVFFKTRGELRIYKCTNIFSANNLENYKIELYPIKRIKNQELKPLMYDLGELIIRPKKIFLSISRNTNARKSEIEIMEWLIRNKAQAYIFLKKPVNNVEIGYIQKLSIRTEYQKEISNNVESNDKDAIHINNIFNKEVRIPYKSLELINFEYDSAMIQTKSSTSFTSRLGYKIMKKIKPQRIIMT